MSIYTKKICLVGDTITGKSTFLYYLNNGCFREKDIPTIGIDFGIKNFHFDNKIIKWQVWDTTGNERFSSMINHYYKSISIFLLFFDTSNKESFKNVYEWLNNIKRYNTRPHKIYLIGNKIDLEINVPKYEIEEFCKKNNVEYFELTLKNPELINNLIKNINIYINQNIIYQDAIREINKSNTNIKPCPRFCWWLF